MRALLILALSLSACAVSIPVRVASELPESATDLLLADASELLGIPIATTDDSHGSITLDIHESPGIYRGRNLIRKGCRRASWASPDAEVIAHEIAHALGLDHVDDPHNLMARSGSGVELTEAQVATMERQAGVLLACP